MNQDTAVILLIQLDTQAYYPEIIWSYWSALQTVVLLFNFLAQEKKDRRLYVVDISVLNEASLQVSSERVFQLYILKHAKEFAYFHRSF